MLKIQQVKTKDEKMSQTRKVVIFDDSFEMNLIITYSTWYDNYYRLIIKWERNLKKLWDDWRSKIDYDKKLYWKSKFEITKTFTIENFWKNEKNEIKNYTISSFIDKLIEELKNYEEKKL